MKKKLCSILTVLILFILQTSIFNYISLGGIMPDLLLILVCVYGFMRGETDGLMAGFFCGLLTDVFFMNFIGFYTLIYMFTGFVIGIFHEYYYAEDIIIPISTIVISDFIISGLKYIFLFLLNGRFDFQYYFVHIILAEAIYTTGVAIILYPLLRLIEVKIINQTLIKEKEDVI